MVQVVLDIQEFRELEGLKIEEKFVNKRVKSILGQGDFPMGDACPLKIVEKQLEQVRKKLYQSVAGEPSRMLDPNVLPISQELDRLIVRYQHLKREA